MFYCLCWKSDKYFPPPAATVAPPETTAGGGAASSAPHPLILHPFQASTQNAAWLTPPRQGTCSTSELEGMVEIILSNSLISQLRRWRSTKGKPPTCVAQGVCGRARTPASQSTQPYGLAYRGTWLGGRMWTREGKTKLSAKTWLPPSCGRCIAVICFSLLQVRAMYPADFEKYWSAHFENVGTMPHTKQGLRRYIW